MIRNIVFDMGQVLLRWNLKMFTGTFGLTEEDEQLLIREMGDRREWYQLDEGVITLDQAVEGMCSELPERLHGCVDAITRGWWNICFRPVEGMGDLIRELKERGFHIWLLSNAPLTLREYFHRIPGSEYFDDVYVSAEHKLLKPDRAIFRDFLKTFSLKGEECFFIDDRAENIEAAGLEGIRGAVFHGETGGLRKELEREGILPEQASGT